MAYRISKSDIEHIAAVLPDAYVLDDDGKRVEIVLQGGVDPKSAMPLVVAVNEENVDEYRKQTRQQLLNEVREVRSFKANMKKRVLCRIVNDAVNSINA